VKKVVGVVADRWAVCVSINRMMTLNIDVAVAVDLMIFSFSGLKIVNSA
jgi:hypothetical protein